MSKEDNWSKISENASDLSKKIKNKTYEENLVEDIKDSFKETIENTSDILNILSETIDTTVKNLNQESRISNFAYAVFRNETGMRFQVPLGPELTVNEFNLNKCNYDRYSLERITTFSWRSSGSSTLKSISVEDKLNPLFDKAFVINSGGQSYIPCTDNLLVTDNDASAAAPIASCSGSYLIHQP